MMIGLIYYVIIRKSTHIGIRRGYLLVIGLWICYLFFIQSTTILADFGMPPRMPLFILIPAFIIVFLIHSRHTFKELYSSTSKHTIVLLQSFRVAVELLIYGAALESIIPFRASFEGLNYDILVGISAIPVSIALSRAKMSDGSLRVWNYLSLLVLSVTGYAFVSSFYSTDYFPLRGELFVKMPYILLPSMLLPMAIFLHVFSLKQVPRKK